MILKIKQLLTFYLLFVLFIVNNNLLYSSITKLYNRLKLRKKQYLFEVRVGTLSLSSIYWW